MRSNISIGGSGNCGPSAEQFAAPAGQQVLVFETVTLVRHWRVVPAQRALLNSHGRNS